MTSAAKPAASNSQEVGSRACSSASTGPATSNAHANANARMSLSLKLSS